MPPSRRERCIGSQSIVVVIRLSCRVLKFPRHISFQCPLISVGDVGIVVDRVDDLEGIVVHQVISEARIKVLVCRYTRHYVGHCRCCLGTLDGRVVAVYNTKFVGMLVAEKRSPNGVIEAVDNGVPNGVLEIC